MILEGIPSPRWNSLAGFQKTLEAFLLGSDLAVSSHPGHQPSGSAHTVLKMEKAIVPRVHMSDGS